MNAKIALLLAVFPAVILCLGFNPGHCEEEFPEWVPEGAVKEARRILVNNREYAEWLFSMRLEDLKRCELKHPFELIEINYLDHEPGEDIKNSFMRNNHYGFGVYLDDEWVADISVKYEDNRWKYLGNSVINEKSRKEDPLGVIYSRFPVGNSTNIYRTHYGERRYFVEQDGKIVKVIIGSVIENGTLYIEPDQHMYQEQERIKRNIETMKKIKEDKGRIPPILRKSEERGFTFPALSKDIPDTVYQIAQEVFRTRWMSSAMQGGSSFSSVSSDTAVDISDINLSDKPIRVLLLFAEDIVNCESGNDVLSKARFRYYTFLVLHNEISIGAVHIYKDENWKMFGYGRCSKRHNKYISELRDMYSESEGYQVDLLGLSMGPSVYWITLISNREEEEYWVTTRSKSTAGEFNLAAYGEGEWGMVLLENILPEFIEKAAEAEKLKQNKGNSDEYIEKAIEEEMLIKNKGNP